MAGPRYPVVLLDVGETLIGPAVPFGKIYAEVLGRADRPLDGELLSHCIHETMAEMAASIPRGADRYRHFPGGEAAYWLQFSRRVLERATGGETVDDTTAAEMLHRLREAFRRREAWKVYDDVVPALDALRDAGIRLGVVSNWDSRLLEVLELVDLAHRFEAVGVSHLEGIEKPDPELFLRVLERMGAEPGDALHVGDVPDLDLEGARRAGIDGVLVDRHGRLDGRTDVIPDLSSLPRIARDGLAAAGSA